MPDKHNTQASPVPPGGDGPWGAIVVLAGLFAVATVAIVAMVKYPQDDATMVVTALGPVIGIIGTIVGAYFGLRGSSLGQSKAAEAEIKRAQIRALAPEGG